MIYKQRSLLIIYRNKEKFQEANMWAERVLEIDGENQEALWLKAASLQSLNIFTAQILIQNDQLTIQYADQLLAIDPQSKFALSTKADALLSLAQYKESIEYANKAIAIEPLYDAMKIKSYSLHDLGRFKGALFTINQALKICPTSDCLFKISFIGKQSILNQMNR